MKKSGFLSLIYTTLVCLVLQAGYLPADCQSGYRRLPKAQFNTYSSGAPSSGSSVGGPSRLSPSAPGIQSTPGLHITKGESRTAQNYADPYNPGEEKLNMQWVRWPREKMPLLIWISPGLELPKMPFDQLQETRVEQVYKMFASGYPLDQLPVAKGWKLRGCLGHRKMASLSTRRIAQLRLHQQPL